MYLLDSYLFVAQKQPYVYGSIESTVIFKVGGHGSFVKLRNNIQTR